MTYVRIVQVEPKKWRSDMGTPKEPEEAGGEEEEAEAELHNEHGIVASNLRAMATMMMMRRRMVRRMRRRMRRRSLKRRLPPKQVVKIVGGWPPLKQASLARSR